VASVAVIGDPTLVPLFVIVLLAWTVQAITGFGSTVLALTLGATWVAIPELLPVTVALNLPLTLWTTVRHRDHVDAAALRSLILPWMSAGVLVGVLLAPWLAGDLLKRGFGVFVLVFALRDLMELLLRMDRGPRPSNRVLQAWILGAGVIHGIYGSGGPALVQATSRLGLDRGAFRATMSAVWLVFNVVLGAVFAASGRYDHAALVRLAILLPAVPIGVLIGERLHPVLPDRAFKGLVQVVLVIGGLALLRG
jgi:uncharacterized membrane protein YfcA